MNIGIFGGTFNPIHNGHLAVAQYAAEECGLDKILFITGYTPPHKSNEIAPSHIRHKLVCLAAEPYDKFIPSDFEIKKGGISYTFETMKALKKIYKSDKLFFIMGADSLRDFKTWRRPEDIVKYCSIIAYPRGNVNIQAAAEDIRQSFGAEVFTPAAPKIEISSSEIRKRINQNKPVGFFLPDNVNAQIKAEGLYA